MCRVLLDLRSDFLADLVFNHKNVKFSDHHGPPRVNVWEDPLSPSKWKEEHVSLSLPYIFFGFRSREFIYVYIYIICMYACIYCFGIQFHEISYLLNFGLWWFWWFFWVLILPICLELTFIKKKTKFFYGLRSVAWSIYNQKDAFFVVLGLNCFIFWVMIYIVTKGVLIFLNINMIKESFSYGLSVLHVTLLKLISVVLEPLVW